MKIAEKWSDVTISQYQEIVNIQADTELSKTVEIISILTDTDSDTIRKMPLGEFYELSSKIGFISTTPDADVNKTFELDGKKYGLIPNLDFITTGEWLDAETWKDKPIDNIHYYAAMLYRPVVKEDGADYQIDEYKVEGFMNRANLFRERLSIAKVFGTQVFFSLFVTESMMNIKDYLQNLLNEEMETKTGKKKAIHPHMRKKSKRPSTKRGGGII